MSATPAAAYLAEFGGDGDVERCPAFVPLGRESGRSAGEAASDRIEAARASGYASGEAAVRAELEAKLAELRQAHGRRLAAERQAWVNGEADKLDQRLASGLAELEASIAHTAARVLEPFLRAELRRQAIAELHSALETLLAKEGGLSVSVTGPEDLLQALRHRLAGGLAGKAAAVSYEVNAEPDVRIAAGHSILETRLGAWVAKIEEAVG